MGDDLYAWAYFAQGPSYHDILLEAPGGKYRPVLNAVHYVLFDLFWGDYRAWLAFNVALDIVIAALVFGLVRKVTRRDNLIAFLAAILFVTSRFSYYNVLQVMGLVESLSLLFLVLIVWTAVVFLRGRSTWPAFALAGLYLLVTLTHERYVVLLPFLLMVVVLKRHLSPAWKGMLAVVMVAPLLANVLLKWLLGAEFLMGTGGQALGLDPALIAEFITKGLANMLWVNAGPWHLSGVPWGAVGGGARLLVGIIVFGIATIAILSVARVLRTRRRGIRVAEARRFLLFVALFFPLLLGASITFRQEFRWLYAPFVVGLVYFAYLASRITALATR